MKITRRQAMHRLTALSSAGFLGVTMASGLSAEKNDQRTPMSQRSELPPYDHELLPDGIRSRFVDNINGLRMHVLEAGYEDDSRPGVLLHYRTREANENMWDASQGLHAFLRGYYHFKSADWLGNKPFRLASRTAAEMAKMPTYYIMDLADGMAETVAKHMPSESSIKANRWLPDKELQVYTAEYQRTGFQGGLNWYRAGGIHIAEKQIFAGRKIEQPSLFISGASDWGSYQAPGRLEQMQDEACTDMRGVHLIDGAGHWVQQEQAEKTGQLLLELLGA